MFYLCHCSKRYLLLIENKLLKISWTQFFVSGVGYLADLGLFWCYYSIAELGLCQPNTLLRSCVLHLLSTAGLRKQVQALELISATG